MDELEADELDCMFGHVFELVPLAVAAGLEAANCLVAWRTNWCELCVEAASAEPAPASSTSADKQTDMEKRRN